MRESALSWQYCIHKTPDVPELILARAKQILVLCEHCGMIATPPSVLLLALFAAGFLVWLRSGPRRIGKCNTLCPPGQSFDVWDALRDGKIDRSPDSRSPTRSLTRIFTRYCFSSNRISTIISWVNMHRLGTHINANAQSVTTTALPPSESLHGQYGYDVL